MTTCTDHDFHEVSQYTYMAEHHAVIVCAYCGQVRDLQNNGVVTITTLEGKLNAHAK